MIKKETGKKERENKRDGGEGENENKVCIVKLLKWKSLFCIIIISEIEWITLKMEDRGGVNMQIICRTLKLLEINYWSG